MKLLKITKIAAVAALLGFAGIAYAQTAGLTVSVSSPAAVAASTGQNLATIRLTAGPADVRLSGLPVSLGYSETAPANPLTNCVLRSGSATAAALNTGVNSIPSRGSGTFMVNFDTALTVPANSSVTLYLTCDIASNTPAGSAIATSVHVQDVVATTSSGTVAVAGSPEGMPTGVTSLPGTATPGTPNTGTPGVPNTGAGGNAAATWVLLGATALIAAGAAYTARRMRIA